MDKESLDLEDKIKENRKQIKKLSQFNVNFQSNELPQEILDLQALLGKKKEYLEKLLDKEIKKEEQIDSSTKKEEIEKVDDNQEVVASKDDVR